MAEEKGGLGNPGIVPVKTTGTEVGDSAGVGQVEGCTGQVGIFDGYGLGSVFHRGKALGRRNQTGPRSLC